jgi:hypothetical protein
MVVRVAGNVIDCIGTPLNAELPMENSGATKRSSCSASSIEQPEKAESPIDLSSVVRAKSRDWRLEQSSNADFSIVWILVPRLAILSWTHRAKQRAPMNVILSGNITISSWLQLLKAWFSNRSNFEPGIKVTFARNPHLANADAPITVTPGGMVTSRSDDLLKAARPMNSSLLSTGNVM